jgi:hypothetical protein
VFEQRGKETVKVGPCFINILCVCGGLQIGRTHDRGEIGMAALTTEYLLPGVFITDAIKVTTFFAFKVYHDPISFFQSIQISTCLVGVQFLCFLLPLLY